MPYKTLKPITQYTADDIPNVLFPSDNPYEIPTLDLAMQATELIMPFAAWGSTRRGSPMAGTWHFYVDDARFSALYDDCSPLLNSGPAVAVETNYSIFNQTAVALALWRTFQKRWLSRYWQSKGIRIIVDLNVGHRFRKINLLGVPKGWRAYSTRGYTDRIDGLEDEFGIAAEHAESSDLLFVVYGGGQHVRNLCQQRGWINIPEHMDTKRRNR